MESIWSKEVEIPRREPLDGNLFTEAAVIGAGMTGILTAYFLQEIGFHVVVLEAEAAAKLGIKATFTKETKLPFSV